MKTKAKRKHVGPGKKIISLYADAEVYERIKVRAKALGIPASTYLQKLALNDIEADAPGLLIQVARAS